MGMDVDTWVWMHGMGMDARVYGCTGMGVYAWTYGCMGRMNAQLEIMASTQHATTDLGEEPSCPDQVVVNPKWAAGLWLEGGIGQYLRVERALSARVCECECRL